MTRAAILVLATLAACAGEHAPSGGGGGSAADAATSPGSPDTADPRTCDQSMTLDGASGSAISATITVGAASLGWCLHLDGLDNTASHLAANTANEAGDASSFQLVLVDPTGATLADGGDISVGNTATQTHASLEYSVAIHQALDVILRTRAPAGTASTTLTVSFFDPLD